MFWLNVARHPAGTIVGIASGLDHNCTEKALEAVSCSVRRSRVTKTREDIEVCDYEGDGGSSRRRIPRKLDKRTRGKQQTDYKYIVREMKELGCPYLLSSNSYQSSKQDIYQKKWIYKYIIRLSHQPGPTAGHRPEQAYISSSPSVKKDSHAFCGIELA